METKFTDKPGLLHKDNITGIFSIPSQPGIISADIDTGSVMQVGVKNSIIETDTIHRFDTVKPPLIETEPRVEKKNDTVPSFYEHTGEKPIAVEDTVSESKMIQAGAEDDFYQGQKEEKITQKDIHPDSVYTVKANSDYFEITDNVFPKHEPAVSYFGEHHLEPQNPVTKVDETASNEWAFPLIVFSLLMVVFAKYFFYGRLKQVFSASIATRFFNQMKRDGNILKEWISVLLFTNFLLVFSLLAYQTLDYLSVLKSFSFSSPLIIVSVFILIVIAFLVIKYYLIKFLGWLFKAFYVSDAYYKNIIIFNMLTGVFLLPFVIINIYVASDILLYATWGIFAATNLFKAIRGLLIGYNIAQFSGYYLILYLCGVELAPLLLIIRFSVNYLNTI